MARVNVEDRAFPKIMKMAKAMRIGEAEVAGHLLCLWYWSQEDNAVYATAQQLIEWADLQDLSVEEKTQWFEALIKFKFIAQTDDDLYEIKGNKTQISSRLANISKASKGGLATKKKFEQFNAEIERKSEHSAENDENRASSQASSLATSPPAGPLGVGSIQSNPSQANPISETEIFERVQKFDLQSLFDLYPRQQKKSQAIKLLSERVRSDAERAEWEKAIRNYARYCQTEVTEHRFVLTFPSFIDEWRDWINWSPPASPQKSLFQRQHVDPMHRVVPD